MALAHGYAHHEAHERSTGAVGHHAESTLAVAALALESIPTSGDHDHPPILLGLSLRAGFTGFVVSPALSLPAVLVVTSAVSLPVMTERTRAGPAPAPPQQPRAPPLG